MKKRQNANSALPQILKNEVDKQEGGRELKERMSNLDAAEILKSLKQLIERDGINGIEQFKDCSPEYVQDLHLLYAEAIDVAVISLSSQE